MIDSFGRKIEYMRVSLTDRCNLRCRYCMPNGINEINSEDVLTYEEIAEICRMAAEIGIKYIKITGGEPLVRKDVEKVVYMIKNIDGIEGVTLTTNGVLLPDKLDNLVNAGIDAINISLDTIYRDRYKKITGFDGLDRVLESIDLCLQRGVKTKLNVVILEENLNECVQLAQFAKNKAIDVRFIEMMPIGEGKNFNSISYTEVIDKIRTVYPDFKEVDYKGGYGPAQYYHIDGFKGNIGFINAVNNVFCQNCNRVRLTANGYIKSCLCYDDGESIREPLREGKTEEVREIIERAIKNKPQRHCFDDRQKISEKRDMSEIGG